MKARIKRLIKRYLAQKSRIRWLVSSNRDSGLKTQIHILLAKDTRYIYFARICAESFLHYHPLCSVILHCDDSTYFKTVKYFKVTKKFRNVEIVNNLYQNKSWQMSKLELLLSLNGTDGIYVDSDLRWNNSIKSLDNITFFVREFKFIDSVEYQKLFSQINYSLLGNEYMWNTSFFTFAKHKVTDETINNVINFYYFFLKSIEKISDKKTNFDSIARLSEQISMSIFARSFSENVEALKISDSRLDGKIAESTYFGSTGLGF